MAHAGQASEKPKPMPTLTPTQYRPFTNDHSRRHQSHGMTLHGSGYVAFASMIRIGKMQSPGGHQ